MLAFLNFLLYNDVVKKFFSKGGLSMLIIETNNRIDNNKVSFELSALKKLYDLFLAQKDILLKHFNIRLMELSDNKNYIFKLNEFLEEFNDLFSKINLSITDINELILKIDSIKKLSENNSDINTLKSQVVSYNKLYMDKYPGLIDCIIYITNFVEELFITPNYEKSIEHRKSVFSAASAYNEKQSKIAERNTNKSNERNKILDEFLLNEKDENKERTDKKEPSTPVVEPVKEKKEEKKVDLAASIPVIPEIDTTLGPIQPDEKPIVRPPRPNPDYKTSPEKPLIEKVPEPSEERIKNAVQNEMNRIVEEDIALEEEREEEQKQEEEEKNEESIENSSDLHTEDDMAHTTEEINKFVSAVDVPDIAPDIEPAIAADNITDPVEEKENKKHKSKKKKEADASIPQRVTKLPLQDNDTLIISERSGYVYLPFKVSDLNSEYIAKKKKYSGLVDLINKEYTIPISKYKNSVTSRFKEAYTLMTNKEKSSALSGLELGLEVAFNYSLHPAVISACKNLDELDEYLDALENKDLSQFNSFKVRFELMPKR